MKLDRAMQFQILNELSAAYPDRVLTLFPDSEDQDIADKREANLVYLQEHGLITVGLHQFIDGKKGFTGAQITATGIDFLADDGGLSAILGVVTIKLHDDTVRQLIEARIQSAELPETTKSHLLKSLREAPGETIKHLTEKLLDAGLENWPTALAAIQKFL